MVNPSPISDSLSLLTTGLLVGLVFTRGRMGSFHSILFTFTCQEICFFHQLKTDSMNTPNSSLVSLISGRILLTIYNSLLLFNGRIFSFHLAIPSLPSFRLSQIFSAQNNPTTKAGCFLSLLNLGGIGGYL